MYYFTTYFDKNYLSRGLVLYDSLKEHCEQFKLFILCLDDFTLGYFENEQSNYPEVSAIPLEQLEESDADLFSCKTNRSVIEYYFTLSPCLPFFLIKKYSLPHICSLDADILFLDNPSKLFAYLDDFSIIITPHKFSKENSSLVRFGEFNVSFQLFKNNEVGINCLEKWRWQCITWCGDHYDEVNDRFADQKYLDEWPSNFPGKVKVLDDNISGIAPWNLNKYKIQKRKKDFHSNRERIIFFHFHHFKIFKKNWAANGFKKYNAQRQRGIDKLYLSYWSKVEKYNDLLTIHKDQSARHYLDSNTWENISRENLVYFKVKNVNTFHVNFKELPKWIKRVLVKLDI